MNHVTAIIADDEENLRISISMLLKRLWPELNLVGQAENGIEALALIETAKPDIVFLDIHMPGMTGIQVAGKVYRTSKVVFITAYDQYAVQAFENETVDYILKPVTEDRLLKTIARLKKAMAASKETASENQRIQRVIQVLENRQTPDYLRLIKVKAVADLRFVPVSQILYFKAEDKYTVVQTPDREYLIKTTIKELDAALDPKHFWRVHRGSIVNVDRIKVIKRSFSNQMIIGFDRTEKAIAVSRSYEHLFKHM